MCMRAFWQVFISYMLELTADWEERPECDVV